MLDIILKMYVQKSLFLVIKDLEAIEDELETGEQGSNCEKRKDLMWFHPKDPKIKLDPKLIVPLFEDLLGLYNAYRNLLNLNRNI